MADYLLKIEPPFLDALLDGTKTFELRRNDRGYQKGDVLVFDLAWPEHPSETSLRCVRFTVSYVLSGWGIEPGFVVLGLAPRGDGGSNG